MIAYIPARGGSKRILQKNIKALGGKPVLGHVIQTLKSVPFIDAVCVSTDDSEIAAVAARFGAEVLGFRTPELADDHTTFADLLKKDVTRYLEHFKISEQTAEILWGVATAALVTPEIYMNAYQAFQRFRPKALVSTVGYPISPYWALAETAPNQWKPLFPDKLSARSQDLPRTQVDACLFYFLRFKDMRFHERSWMDLDGLYCYEVPHSIAVDVDSMDDWEELERKFAAAKKVKV